MRTARIVEVELEDEVGSLARAARALGERGVGVRGFSLSSRGCLKRARFATDHPGQAREALASVGLARRETEAVLVPATCSPDCLSHLGDLLADVGLDARSGFLVDDAEPAIALEVDDVERARRRFTEAREARPIA